MLNSKPVLNYLRKSHPSVRESEVRIVTSSLFPFYSLSRFSDLFPLIQSALYEVDIPDDLLGYFTDHFFFSPLSYEINSSNRDFVRYVVDMYSYAVSIDDRRHLLDVSSSALDSVFDSRFRSFYRDASFELSASDSTDSLVHSTPSYYLPSGLFLLHSVIQDNS